MTRMTRMIDRLLRSVKCKRNCNPRKSAKFAVYLLLITSVISALARADDASYLPEAKSVGIGFANHYKLGCWTPVQITLSGAFGDSGSGGRIDVQAPDGEGLPVWFTGPRLILGQTVTAYVRIGRAGQSLAVRLAKRINDSYEDPELLPASATGAGATALPAAGQFILEIGQSIGLDQVFKRDETDPQRATTVVTLDGSQPLPDEWFGYEGVDQVVIAGAPAETWQDPKAVAALERWVRLGGSLWIVSGADAQEVLGKGKPLATFAPGELAGVITLPPLSENFGPIQHFGGADEPIAARPLRAPQWQNVIGRVELSAGGQQSGLPLMIRYPRGFGQVTYIGLDLHKPPFSEWAGRVKFLEKLLARRSSADQSAAIHGANQAARLGFTDISGQLRGALDQFDGVDFIPFWIVAVLALAYIAILFPLNYWVLNRWLKRPMLAWLFFPTAIVIFCIAAVAVANHAKGAARRVNQLDLVDVNVVDGGHVRGTTWFDLFSPENALYDLRVEPTFAGATLRKEDESPSMLLSWLGLAGKGLGGMSSGIASAPLFDQTYTIDRQKGVIEGVPIPVWSSKPFIARWEAGAQGIESDLVATRDRKLRGTLTSELNAELTDCLLLFDRWAYPIGTIPAHRQSPPLERIDPFTVEGYLTKRRTGTAADEVLPYDRAGFEVPRIIELMMSHELAGGENYTGLVHRYLHFTDLSSQLQFDRAILVASGPNGATVLINGEPTATVESNHHWTIYRYLLPVKPRD
jgi:hypothetical protein